MFVHVLFMFCSCFVHDCSCFLCLFCSWCCSCLRCFFVQCWPIVRRFARGDAGPGVCKERKKSPPNLESCPRSHVREITRHARKRAGRFKLADGLADAAWVTAERVGERARRGPHQRDGHVHASEGPKQEQRSLCERAGLGKPAHGGVMGPSRREHIPPVV